ncbi:MAG: hypothetical protein LBV49_10885 [Azonexus sp.]|jgi:hypothetical protein|nr:hypothetical protein [Azonexus sp.]
MQHAYENLLDGDAGKPFTIRSPKEDFMSGQDQNLGLGLQGHIPLPLNLSGIAARILRVRLATWDVLVTNKRTGRTWRGTYRGASVEDAWTSAFDRVKRDEEESGFDEYEICATLVHGVRKLWDVVPVEQPPLHEAVALAEPARMSRVIADDAQQALEAAEKIFDAETGCFYVRQV